MKKVLFLVIALMLGWAASAQNTSACPGFKNPASFTSGATSGANIGYYSGATGVKNNDSPNSLTGTTGYTMSTVLTAAQLSSQSSSGSSYCGSTLESSKRYRIMSSTEGPGTGSQLGKDPIANNYALSYCPTEYDPSITKSIRLGNCYVDGAEALYYTMRVSTSNSLMSVYYAINVQNPSHGTTGNPAFVVRVCRQNGTTWSQISDTLCYAISSASAANGVDGWHSYSGTGGSAFYRDWNKVAINLIDYLYENVRLEFYIGDCVYNAHFGYCYIAGDCQPMEIRTSGCPAGATTVVTNLSAPEGLTSYTWYRSKTGGQYIANMSNIPNTVTWQQLTPGNSGTYTYDCQIEDFRILEGEGINELTNNMVFRCDMTSAMDPAKPFTSQLYARVNNTKPLMAIDTLKNCDGGVTLTNMSYVPNDMDGCDTAHTKWWLYSGSNGNTEVIDSAEGAKIYATWDSCGQYAVKVRSFNADDHECYSDSTYTVNALCRPNPIMEVEPDNEVCAADSVILHDRTVGCVRHDWVIDDVTYPGPRRNHTNTEFGRVFTKYRTPVELVAYNGLFTRDSINTYDTIWCTASAYDTIEVFQHPELLVEGDTIVCNGQMTDITVSTETEGCTYRWFYTLGAPNSQQITQGQRLQTLLTDDTVKFYVKVISPKTCEAWDSVYAYRVNPTLSISRHDMCDGDYVTLTADKAYNYSWIATPEDESLNLLLDEDGIGPNEITVQPRENTTYTLIGHGTNGCNADPLTEYINVHPIPEAAVDAYPDFVDSDNPVVTLTDVSPYSVSRVWYFNDGIGEEYSSPCSHNFGEVSADSVEVTLVAYNDLSCSDTLVFRLPVTQFTFYAPNVFTPERPDNNKFRIYTANKQEFFSVYIYDRMGRLVYSSNELDFAWDGTTVDGLKCPQGGYAWVVRYRRPGTEDIVTQKGVITLVR